MSFRGLEYDEADRVKTIGMQSMRLPICRSIPTALAAKVSPLPWKFTIFRVSLNCVHPMVARILNLCLLAVWKKLLCCTLQYQCIGIAIEGNETQLPEPACHVIRM
jgi:hypothetical protein